MKINKFKKFTETYGEEFGVTYHGEYGGRGFHSGIAVRAESIYGIAKFVSEMEKNKIKLGSWDHQDQLGYGHVFSWSKSRFDDVREVAA
jgi:hypothetical protein|tara:strand:- start:175 stop:441 length:267 start_codon:yes stop_codon:yes gene_type:complete